MSLRKSLTIAVLFLIASLPFAAIAQQSPANGATVHGMVVDPDDALVPGAIVTLAPASGKPVSTTSKSDGTYTFRGVAPGTFTLTVTAPGFGTFTKGPISLTMAANVTADVKLSLQDVAQAVNVTTETVQLSVDPDNNASSTVITGDALDALSDDPDDLQAELTALAGPSAGPNGGQIYIDGFTGGQLPPKSSILAIRINQNPFSAQYERLGYGRIEIITKPGTDKFHGNVGFQFGDKYLNTSTPFLGASNVQPEYHTIFGQGNVTGPIRPGTSFTLSGSRRNVSNNSIINPSAIYSTSLTPDKMCDPGTLPYTLCSANPYPTALRAVPAPQVRWDISPRVDTMIGSKNMLTTRFQYEAGDSTNNGGNNSLPTRGSTSSSSEMEIQVGETQLLSSKIINETRFEYQRDSSNSSPFNPKLPSLSVQGGVSAGGSGGGSVNSNTGDHIEFQNYTSLQLTKNFVRFGGRLRTSTQTVSSNGNTVGSFTYPYLLDPCTDPSLTTRPSNCISSPGAPCSATNMIVVPGSSPSTLAPLYASYQCGIPLQFTQTTVNNQTTNARETDVGLYAEDDWKVLPNFTLSYGIRYEAQNFISSTHDFAPRTSLAYGIPRKSGKTVTVLRAGFGIFYDRYGLGGIANIIQNNPTNQTNKLYRNPGTAIAPCGPSTIGNCTSGTGQSAGSSQIPVAGPGLRAPYTMETAATVEQQVGKYGSVSVTYLNARGVHQMLSRVFRDSDHICPNANATLNGYTQCSESEGVYRQNQINTNVNIRTPKGINLFGYYSANWANSNLSGITNPFNSATDYGRAAYGSAIRSQMTFGGTIPLPFLITASPILTAQSGSPYNITTGVDNNSDGVTDDRPAFASGFSAANASCINRASFDASQTTLNYTAGEIYPEIPINFCTGPARVSVNLRLSRTFGFGPKTESTRGGGQGGPGGGGPGGGGPGGYGGGGGGGRGGDHGGGGGGGGRSGSNTGHKYNLSIGAQAQNLFNEVPYASPVSTMSNSRFGQTISLGGGGFGGGGGGSNAVRHIMLQANFSF